MTLLPLRTAQTDQVPMGHIPRTMTVYLYNDQTRQMTAGDHVTISGVGSDLNAVCNYITIDHTPYFLDLHSARIHGLPRHARRPLDRYLP